MQKRLEIQARLRGAAVGQPGNKDCQRFSLLILDDSVVVCITVHAAKLFGKGHAAARRELVEHRLRFFVQSADNTNIERLRTFFHIFSLCTKMCLIKPKVFNTARLPTHLIEWIFNNPSISTQNKSLTEKNHPTPQPLAEPFSPRRR